MPTTPAQRHNPHPADRPLGAFSPILPCRVFAIDLLAGANRQPFKLHLVPTALSCAGGSLQRLALETASSEELHFLHLARRKRSICSRKDLTSEVRTHPLQRKPNEGSQEKGRVNQNKKCPKGIKKKTRKCFKAKSHGVAGLSAP